MTTKRFTLPSRMIPARLGRFRHPPEVKPFLWPIKCRLIDAAFERIKPSSFADLGGVWAVEAGYTFYALQKAGVERGCLVDFAITEPVRKRAKNERRLKMFQLDFASSEAAQSVGTVDVLFLFDVLLHQVDPDWHTVLEMWAARSNALLIASPHWIAGDNTLRLLELGRADYEALVPHQPIHDEAWEHLDEIHPKYGKPYRNIHEIWQWGITAKDLQDRCKALGFEPMYFEDQGVWQEHSAFHSHAFCFIRP